MFHLAEWSESPNVTDCHHSQYQQCLDLKIWIVRHEYYPQNRQISSVQEQNVEHRRIKILAVQLFKKVFELFLHLSVLLKQMLIAMNSNVMIDSEC